MPERISYSPRGRIFKLTDEMIDLRDRLATGLGYVLRRCSMGRDGECWENALLDCEREGRPTSSYHCCRFNEIGGVRSYGWPGRAEVAAYAIDKGKPAVAPEGGDDA